MKILGNLLKILIVVLLVYVLIQNAEQKVNLQLFTLFYPDIHLSIVLLLTLAIGAIFGAVLMSVSIIHLRGEIRDLQRRNKQLNRELENLRNISVDEIPEEDAPDTTESNS
jgi:uncharacterized integral membrane protein